MAHFGTSVVTSARTATPRAASRQALPLKCTQAQPRPTRGKAKDVRRRHRVRQREEVVRDLHRCVHGGWCTFFAESGGFKDSDSRIQTVTNAPDNQFPDEKAARTIFVRTTGYGSIRCVAAAKAPVFVRKVRRPRLVARLAFLLMVRETLNQRYFVQIAAMRSCPPTL